MHVDPVQVVFPCRVLPFPTVIGEIRVLNEVPECRHEARFAFGASLCNDLRYHVARFALGHFLYQSDDPAFLHTGFIPEANPSAPLFSDTSHRAPLTHIVSPLCAFAASFWRLFQRSILVALDPCYE